MKWSIDKEFNFEMGHRVWAQKLNNPELSISTECACKHLHGHSYTVKVFLTADTLDPSGMVIDFKNLNFMKVFLDDTLDHKFMIDVNDPNFELITGTPSPYHLHNRFENLSKLYPSADSNLSLHRNSFVLVDFVPTSENICKALYAYAQIKLGDMVKVDAVELWETKKSHCRYSE